MSDYQYIGDELTIFEHAVRWKAYFRSKISVHIVGDVLEVGAGIGATSAVLCDGRQESWTGLEPDEALANQAQQRYEKTQLPVRHRLIVGTIESLPQEPTYDTILYIDVLEHIEQHHQELANAAKLLKPGGKVIVLAPAHQYLFSEFDAQVGHFRRYSATSLAAAAPSSLQAVKVFYLDSVGMLASLANRLLLRSGEPTISQIRFWDSVLVPISRLLDPLLMRRLGKSVVGIWTRPSTSSL
jgi:ubiquinone/menaquinone biosynthesis C-methylase UbiE